MGIASFFIPQAEVQVPFPRVSSPYLDCLRYAEAGDTEMFVYQTALLLAPVLACLLLLAGALPGAAGSAAIHWIHAGFFITWAFALSTLGSLSSTQSMGEEASSGALLLFAGPLVLATVVLGRVMGGSDPRATGAIVRGSLGLLLLIDSLFDLTSGAVRWLPGAAVPLLAGALIAASGVLSWVRPAAPPSPAPQGA